ncbi:TadE/TadG family type IV pilus assembly protein [Pseudactinotalea sp. Z1748]|uniref:TadE/TadG family type IV pilus assembly protein n=1 Tax=Pseudactinotalea sp. Z1748 TaxID=3413027 RepID=UPI003C7DB6ED
MREQRGGVAVQYALVYPVLLLVLIGLLQSAFYYHSLNGVRHAADRAVQVSQSLGGSGPEGVSAAQQVLSQTGTIGSISIEVDRGAEFVTAHVTGESMSLLGFWAPTVSATAEGPVERWTEP